MTMYLVHSYSMAHSYDMEHCYDMVPYFRLLKKDVTNSYER